MLKQLKRTVLGAAKSVGVFSHVQKSKWRQEKLLILAYHGVAIDDEDQWKPEMFLRQEDFRERVLLIRNSGCSVLPLSEALERLYAGTLPPRSVALTFDDGNYDFYQQAYPVLKEFDFPTTVYLTTYYSYYNKPVFNMMSSYLLWKGRHTSVNLKELTGDDLKLELGTGLARTTVWRALLDLAGREKLSAEAKEDISARLAKQLHVDYDELLHKRILHIMTPEEVHQIASEGVDIQLHTHRHRTPPDRSRFAREIVDNRNCIQAMTSKYATHFCYPGGFRRETYHPWLKELSVESATTCEAGIATRQTNVLLLPRVVDGSHLSAVEFEGWLTGVSAVLPQRKAK
jgi:peptidoglycan/xylan/chitin deacetylase (PgdA/CDA1 family)